MKINSRITPNYNARNEGTGVIPVTIEAYHILSELTVRRIWTSKSPYWSTRLRITNVSCPLVQSCLFFVQCVLGSYACLAFPSFPQQLVLKMDAGETGAFAICHRCITGLFTQIFTGLGDVPPFPATCIFIRWYVIDVELLPRTSFSGQW